MSDNNKIEQTLTNVDSCTTSPPARDLTEPEPLEHMLARHSNEKRDLDTKIAGMRKSIPPRDKKCKRRTNEKISQLEDELKYRQEDELRTLKGEDATDELDDGTPLEQLNNLVIEEEPVAPTPTPTEKPKKRNRVREKLERREKEMQRLQEEALNDALNKEDKGKVEEDTIQALLVTMGLRVNDIAADGHCLYNAISDQLARRYNTMVPYRDLRSEAATFMRDHPDDFLPFLLNDSGDMYDTESFQTYCKDVQSTALWGGEPEIMALSNARQVPIHIIQAGAPVHKINEEAFPDVAPLKLAYYKHLYSLGAHYNSLLELDN